MPFAASDSAVFLADFGVPCVGPAPDNVAFVALLDQPDELQLIGEAGAHTRQYALTYATGDVTLARGQAITVDGLGYTVREAPRRRDDGLFTVATLTRS